MIKRIIFDLDNTLISNVDFNAPLIQAFDELGYFYTEKDLYLIQHAIGRYEYVSQRYDKEEMLKFFKLYSNMNLDKQFFDVYFEHLKNLVPESLETGVYDTLDYLASKYKMCVLTNWFASTQESRLKNAGIMDFFERVYGGEIAKKPQKEAYLNACSNVDPSETLMIGDSYVFDYLGAKEAGLNAILLDKKEEHNLIKKRERIKEVKQLKKVL